MTEAETQAVEHISTVCFDEGIGVAIRDARRLIEGYEETPPKHTNAEDFLRVNTAFVKNPYGWLFGVSEHMEDKHA